MKRIIAIIISLSLVLTLFASTVVNAEDATIYYVSENGSDETGDGTKDNPFKTVNKATTLVPTGDATIYVTGAVDLSPAAHTGMITITGTDDTAMVKYVGYMNTNGPLTIEKIKLYQSGAVLYTDGHKFILDGERNGNSKASYMFGNKTQSADNLRDEDITIVNNTKGTLNPGTDFNIGHFGSVAITGAVEFLHKAGHIRWLNFSTSTTFKGDVNLTIDSFTQRTDDVAQGYAEKVTGTPIFEKAFQVIYNNGIVLNIKTEKVFETNAITANEGKWIIYAEKAADGSVLRTTDTAGKFLVEGSLMAKAYKVVDGVEQSTYVKSKEGVLDLSGIEKSGIYNVKFTEPEVFENDINEVFVSATGNDTNNGLTSDTAFATIDFAQKVLSQSTAEGEKIINVIGTVEFDGGEPHDEMITINAHTSATLTRKTTSGNFTELKGPTKFVGFNIGWNDVGYPLSSGYKTEYIDLQGRNRIFVGNMGNGNLNSVENVVVNDSYYVGDNDRSTVYIGTNDTTKRTVAGVNFHFVNGQLAQFRLSDNNIYIGDVNITLDKFGCMSSGVQLLVDGENIEFNKAFQFIINNGYSEKITDLSVFENINAKDGEWFIYSDVASDGSVLRATETAGIFKVEGNLVANAYKVVNGVESDTPVLSLNGILDLSGSDNAGIYNVRYTTRTAQTNNDSVVYVSSNGSDLADGKTLETAFGTLEFAMKWLALSDAENRTIILNGEEFAFSPIEYSDMITVTSTDGSTFVKFSDDKLLSDITFDNVNIRGRLYSNGNKVVINENCVLEDKNAGVVIGATSSDINKQDEVIINAGGPNSWSGHIRIGANKSIASNGLKIVFNKGTLNQFIFSDWAYDSAHNGDVNLIFNGNIAGYGSVIGGDPNRFIYNGAFQLILNGANESLINENINNIDAKDGEWFMFGDKTAKLDTTAVEGEFTFTNYKYAKAINTETNEIFCSQNGILKVPEGKYNVTYFNTLKTGDINNDGDIDIRDLVGIKNSISEILPYNFIADLNKDNIISANDTVLIIKHLLGAEKIEWEDTLKHLSNTYNKLVNDKELNVLFMGGSVTDGYGSTGVKNDGWPTLICNWLADKYDANITEDRQSIGGTGSYFGAFRFEEDVKTVPDLFFIEFAINDRYEEYTYDETVKYSETLVRNALELNPNMDIIYVLTFDRGSGVKTDDYDNLRAHRDVANKYGFLCIKLADEFYEIMDQNGTKDYDFIPDGVHPNDDGYEIYSKIIIKHILSDLPAKNTITPEIKEIEIPEALSSFYENPNLVMVNEIEFISTDGWYLDTAGKTFLENRYCKAYKSSTAGSKLKFEFNGNSLGIAYTANNNLGNISVKIDDNDPVIINGYYKQSNPKAKLAMDNLQNGKHTVEITLIDGTFNIPCLLIN